MRKKRLTGKEQAFIEHYCTDAEQIGCRAYRMAGYSMCKGWEHNAIKILHKDYIKQAIEVKLKEIGRKTEVTVEFVVDKIKNGLLLAEQRNNLTAMARFVELLGRYKAMFTDNLNTSDTTKQKQLAEKEREEAKRIANIRLREA